MGSREVLEYRPNPSGMAGAPPVKVFGPAKWLTYAEVAAQASDFGLGLVHGCGLFPQPEPRAGADGPSSEGFDAVAGASSLCIFENTCAAWMVAALGSFGMSLCVTTVYATLGSQAVVDVVNEGSLKVVLCNRSVAAEFAARHKDMPSLTHLIVSDDAVAASPPAGALPASAPGLAVLSVDDVLRLGRSHRGKPACPPSPASVAVVMCVATARRERAARRWHLGWRGRSTVKTLPRARLWRLSCRACRACRCAPCARR